MSGIGGIDKVGDVFMVNGQEYDLETLLMALQMDRVDMLDKQIQDQANEMKAKNARMAQLNELISQARTHRDDNQDYKSSVSDNTPSLTVNGTAKTLKQWFDHYGLTWTDVRGTGSTRSDALNQNYNALYAKFQATGDSGVLSVMNHVDIMRSRSQDTNEYLGGASGNTPMVTINGVEKSMADWFDEFGIAWGDVDGDKDGRTADWDTNISNIKSKIDTLNNNSQLDMIRLQGLMNKRNQSFETMTNAMTKLNKPKETVIANMR